MAIGFVIFVQVFVFFLFWLAFYYPDGQLFRACIYSLILDGYIINGIWKFFTPDFCYLKLNPTGLEHKLGSSIDSVRWEDIELITQLKHPTKIRVVPNPQTRRRPLILLNSIYLDINTEDLYTLLTEWEQRYKNTLTNTQPKL